MGNLGIYLITDSCLIVNLAVLISRSVSKPINIFKCFLVQKKKKTFENIFKNVFKSSKKFKIFWIVLKYLLVYT